MFLTFMFILQYQLLVKYYKENKIYLQNLKSFQQYFLKNYRYL
jgi:hypothetical protein